MISASHAAEQQVNVGVRIPPHQRFTLANGVRVIADPAPGFETLALTVVAGRGARTEVQSQAGWAHLLEHMVFKGAGARSARDIVDDPQYAALGSIATVTDKVLGPIRMPNVPFRLSKTPGKVRWPGPALGEDSEGIFSALGLSQDRLRELRERGVI